MTMLMSEPRVKRDSQAPVKARLILEIDGASYEFEPFCEDARGVSLPGYVHWLGHPDGRWFSIFEPLRFEAGVETRNTCKRCRSESCVHVRALSALGIG